MRKIFKEIAIYLAVFVAMLGMLFVEVHPFITIICLVVAFLIGAVINEVEKEEDVEPKDQTL